LGSRLQGYYLRTNCGSLASEHWLQPFLAPMHLSPPQGSSCPRFLRQTHDQLLRTPGTCSVARHHHWSATTRMRKSPSLSPHWWIQAAYSPRKVTLILRLPQYSAQLLFHSGRSQPEQISQRLPGWLRTTVYVNA